MKNALAFFIVLVFVSLIAVSCAVSPGNGGGDNGGGGGGSSSSSSSVLSFWEDDSANWIGEVFYWGIPETPDLPDETQSGALLKSRNTLTGSFNFVRAAAKPPVPYAVDPIFNPVEGTYTVSKRIQIKSTTSGAVVHYTTNGSIPTAASPVLGTLTLSSGTVTVKAIAVLNGMGDSRIVQATYTFQPAPPAGTVGAPAFSPVEGTYNTNKSVQIKSQTSGAVIHYTVNGPDPTTASAVYSTPIPVSSGTTVIKAIAVKSGLTTSAVITQTFNVTGIIDDPVFTLVDNPTGKYISIGSAAAGADIYYTLDGSIPNELSTHYTDVFPLPVNKTIRARAYQAGWTTSHTVDYAYTTSGKTANPVFSVPGGNYDTPFDLVMSCPTPGSAVFWSIDGGINWNWKENNTICIASNITVMAKAVRTGYDDSDTANAGYIIRPKLDIVFPVNGQTLYSPLITVTGTASASGCQVKEVYVSLNNGTFTKATGTESWNNDSVLIQGTNILKAYCLDDRGISSSTNIITVFSYNVIVKTLNLNYDGAGIAVDSSGNFYWGWNGPFSPVFILTASDQSSYRSGIPLDGSVSIAIDSSGNIYITETENPKIWRFGTDGSQKLLAGTGFQGESDGMGTNASFWYPLKMAADNNGILYVFDAASDHVRKVTPDGMVTTLGIQSTGGVAVDSDGNLYYIDGNVIKKYINESTIITVAGSPSGGSQDGAGTNASFAGPWDLALDASGNIYVTDMGNSKIRKITSDGVVSTLAGTGVAGWDDGTGSTATFKWPFYIAVSPSGKVIVIDYEVGFGGGPKIREIIQ